MINDSKILIIGEERKETEKEMEERKK